MATGTTLIGERCQQNKATLWWNWVGANTLAETIGLGGSVIIGILVAQTMGETVMGTLVAAAVLIIAGTFLEGVLIGAFQWLVLRQALPSLRWQSWVKVTALGAGIAWFLGMIPSTFMSLQASTTTEATPMAEPDTLFMVLLGLLMGLVLGPFIGVPQWLVLRRHVQHAGWWIPANSAAWMVGMVIIFIGAGSAPSDTLTPSTILFTLVMLALTGAIVGAIHGWVLVYLVERTRTKVE